MNIVRDPEVAGAAAGGDTRVPHDPQNANPGAICLPQVAQMTSAVGAAVPAEDPSVPAAEWACIELPMGGVPPPLVGPLRGIPPEGGPAVGKLPLPGDGACTMGEGVNCAGILGESPQGMPPLAFWAAPAVDAGCRSTAGLISPEATAAGGGVGSTRDGAGTNSVRAIARGGGVFSAGGESAATRGAGAGVATAGPACGGGAAGTAFASSFPHPRQNL